MRSIDIFFSKPFQIQHSYRAQIICISHQSMPMDHQRSISHQQIFPSTALTSISLPTRNDLWVNALSAAPQNEHETDAAPRASAAASLYAERKQHYDAQQMNFRPFDPTKAAKRRRDDPVANVVREIHYRNSFGNSHTYPNVPAPDYSPSLPRVVNHFESRPPLRSALRSSRY